jgi:hypothetical protein
MATLTVTWANVQSVNGAYGDLSGTAGPNTFDQTTEILFDFFGTDLDINANGFHATTPLRVSVDGGSYSSPTFVDSTSPQTVRIASGQTNGWHTIHVKFTNDTFLGASLSTLFTVTSSTTANYRQTPGQGPFGVYSDATRVTKYGPNENGGQARIKRIKGTFTGLKVFAFNGETVQLFDSTGTPLASVTISASQTSYELTDFGVVLPGTDSEYYVIGETFVRGVMGVGGTFSTPASAPTAYITMIGDSRTTDGKMITGAAIRLNKVPKCRGFSGFSVDTWANSVSDSYYDEVTIVGTGVEPDAIFVLLGVNDGGVSQATMRTNYGTIITRLAAKSTTARIIAMQDNSVSVGANTNAGIAQAVGDNPSRSEYMTTAGLVTMTGSPNTWTADGTHFLNPGYALMAAGMAEQVTPTTHAAPPHFGRLFRSPVIGSRLVIAGN